MLNGVLAINKPRGMTSHDVVFKLRKILKTKKVGHTGTLDPEVDGVLPICIGPATRISDYIMNSGKRYTAEITIGIQTTTEDQTGEIISADKIVNDQYSNEEIDDALAALTGHIEQMPPMFSAVKVKGRKLYEYARAGLVIDRPTRMVHIKNIERTTDLHYCDDTMRFSIEVSCGKGTYIRTLATQIAEKLNTVGHMSKLTRTESGGFMLEDCYTLEQIAETEDVQLLLRPIEEGLKDLPQLSVDETIKTRVKNGQKFRMDELPVTEPTVIVSEKKALAIYAPHPEKAGQVKAIKVFS
ncbi:tRNA pseudouridine(55) synthase TruB [Macrococcus lamae]|uniref:tRNA pseudouridine synthase B n=1 Tax=Macrococcus lamae TaxID=198484 RepID=A0A4R6BUV8_9STAP|nr:tRNA pseudouridine(55) synthase TruB [Macrococcus lamae]TDM11879.1 tRNA pseudouridine(55) synthase TruB [Macrococcus lamae]